MHIHIKSVHECSIVSGKEDAPPTPQNKTKQISNRKRPSSKCLSNINLFDVSLMHVACFGCRMFPMQWMIYIQGWLLKLKPPKYTHASRGSMERPGRSSPPRLSGKCMSSCLPLISFWGRGVPCSLCWLCPTPLAPCPTPHCGPALGEGGAGQGAPRWRSRPRSSPACSLAAPGLSGYAAAETLLGPTPEVWWCSSSPVGARGKNVKQGLVWGGDGKFRRGQEGWRASSKPEDSL